jgi:hypothetical protein
MTRFAAIPLGDTAEMSDDTNITPKNQIVAGGAFQNFRSQDYESLSGLSDSRTQSCMALA